MATPEAALGADDYGQLLGMLTASDEATRSQGQSLAKKLTPAEQRGFFDYQQQANGNAELHRPDNSIGGLPPELALTSGMGIARAMAGQGLTLAGRAVAGAKEAVGQAAPLVKYEATKTALEHFGVPAPMATALAMAVAGYKRGAKPPTAAASVEAAAPATRIPAQATGTQWGHMPMASVAPEAEAAAVAGPPASSPAAPAPVAAPSAPPSAPPAIEAPTAARPPTAMSPQRIQNELGLAARRAKVTLTEREYAQAAELVATTGLSPVEAVAQMKTPQPTAVAPPTSTAAPQAALAKLRLNGAETQAYWRLVQMGKTSEEAMQAIEMQRALAQQLGTPSSETVRKAVAERNATGRWGTTK